MTAGSFVGMARELGELLPRPIFGPDAVADIDAGRAIAREVAAHLRTLAPLSEPDFLMHTTTLVCKARPGVAVGFFRELQLIAGRSSE